MKIRYLNVKNVDTILILLGIFQIPSLANAYDVFVGNQSGGGYGSEGDAAIYQYEGGTSWSDISVGINIGQAVMDLEIFNNDLYAATQTRSGYGGENGDGQVWRYDGTNWEQIGQMGTSVMDLIIYRDTLYAIVTDNYESPVGKMYSYDGTTWHYVDGIDYSGFFVATVSNLSGNDEIVIGELNTDAWSTYSPEEGLNLWDDWGGSCVWDFAEYEGVLYSGHYWGPIYGTDDARTWEEVAYQEGNSWALEVFQQELYIGGDGYDGKLKILETGSLYPILEYPGSNITRLAATPDDFLLYIGTGIRDGYYDGNGWAEVWAYDGTNFTKVSPDDYFSGGVQSIVIGSLNAPPNCEAAIASIEEIWPPNHQWVEATILNITDPDGDLVSIDITSITSDEPTASDKGSGGSKHAPDAQGLGSSSMQLRSERSGKGNGRIYGISFTASDPQEATCSGYVTVCVPHNQGGVCIDSGQDYDATGFN